MESFLTMWRSAPERKVFMDRKMLLPALFILMGSLFGVVLWRCAASVMAVETKGLHAEIATLKEANSQLTDENSKLNAEMSLRCK